MSGPSLSLLIPAYNAARFLPRLLASAHAQTDRFDEIWVYDDCSTDDTAAVAASLGYTDGEQTPLTAVLNMVAGFQALGTLMAVGLMMLPAAAARFWTSRVETMAALAVVIGMASCAAGLLLSAIPAGLFAIKFRSGSALHLISGIDPAKVRDPAALGEFVGLLFLALAGLLALAAGAVAVVPESVLPVVVGLLVGGSVAFSIALVIGLHPPLDPGAPIPNEQFSRADLISMQILSCTIDLNPLPKYPKNVEVSPYGNVQVMDCMTEDGWHYLPQMNPDDPLQVELCGKACADFQMSGQLDIQYRCPNSG